MGALTLILGGCGLFGGGTPDTTTSPTTSPDITAAPAATPAATPVPGQTPAPGQPFPSPTVPGQQPPIVGTLPPDLIGSTNPQERLRTIQRPRPDPFALVPTQPIVQLPEEPPQPPNFPGGIPRGQQGTAGSPSGTTGGTTGTGQRGQPIPRRQGQSPENTPQQRPGQPGQTTPNADGNADADVEGSPSPIAPPPPQPELARAVKVTGVVQVGSTPYVIVSAPNEPFSRYVTTGQSLSNGQVLVKRIVVNQGAEPFVVLEQYGIEVVRAVGEGGTPTPPGPNAPPTPTAVTPDSTLGQRS